MATNVFTFYSDSLKGSFDSAYVGKCLQAAGKELLTLTDSISEYRYTLYYYDQAGNLVKTVPPAGVVRSYDPDWLSDVKAARLNGTSLVPDHTLVTNYRYNTLNTMIAQSTPDAGRTSFWYDRLGRLVLSQNAKQLSEGGNYSYTLYDPLSRIAEVGQINSGVGAVTTSTTKVPASWEAWLGNNATNRYQVTNTIYDLPAAGIDPLLTQNPSTLRNRVSYSSITPGQKGSEPVYSTYYNYDIEGNVSSLLQDYGSTGPMHDASQQYKRIDYGYDLVSGKVNSVSYQAGKPDAFMHFYRYDAENRLTDVYTTADSVTVEHEAHYEYYKHGPLARALIGQNQVQGLDYAYTLQGWLKAVNGSTLDSVNDMGRDGDPATQSRKYIAKDAYGFSLHYFEGDYQPINGTAFLTDLKTKLRASYKGLYNGNISSMAVNIGILNNPKLYNYRYDQLNRLTGMDMLNGTNNGLNLWTNNLTPSNDYTEKASYDPNGNILTYIRHGYGATPAMDSMTYHYEAGTNKLNHIADGVPSGNYPSDLDDQSADNYTYDAAGNLIRDNAAGITTDMTWSVYGKLLTIPSKSVSYSYDAAGNRIGKTVGTTSTWYVRDAQGNILTTYSGEGMAMQERDLYGSSRLGTISNPAVLSTTPQYLDHLGSGTLFTFTRGTKLFELTNHLGNVLATVSDKKFGTPVTGIPSQIAYYTADVKSAQDYYPFGMEMPGRQFNATTYTYGFNGQMKSDEIGGPGNHTTAEFWEYDTRNGRRWNLDLRPTVGISEYSVFNGNPIWVSDILGDSGINPIMPRHPVKNFSDWGYEPYNFIGTLVNGAQSLLSKGGDYLHAASKGDPVEGINTQISNDYNSVKEFVAGEVNYYKNTPNDKIAADTKAFFSNPDNYFQAAENAFGILAIGKLAISEGSAFSRIKIAENFSLRNGVTANGVVQVEQYSLRALEDGFYPVMKRGFSGPQELTWLNRGDVWKFGTTKNPFNRYSQSFLKNTGEGLNYNTEFLGTLKQATTLERMKILNFKTQNNFLPAGNKILK